MQQRSRTQTQPFNLPVVTTEVGDLPFTLEAGVKVFHLVAEVVRQRILPDKEIDVWGYNGSAPVPLSRSHYPGPTIQVTQGDR